jgi:hypothetical protein
MLGYLPNRLSRPEQKARGKVASFSEFAENRQFPGCDEGADYAGRNDKAPVDGAIDRGLDVSPTRKRGRKKSLACASG